MKLTTFVFLLFGLLLAACATQKNKQAETPAGAGKATLIGSIDMVNPEQNYVVIRTDQMLAIATGTELTALSAEGKKSKLKITPERKGHYLTADIIEGSPEVAQLVLLMHSSLPPPAPVQPVVPEPRPTSVSMPTLPLPTLPNIQIQDLPPVVRTAPTVSDPASEPPVNLGDLEPPVK